MKQDGMKFLKVEFCSWKRWNETFMGFNNFL